jgi:hypothetical protein
MFTHHAFQEMWERVKNDKLATRELCYQLERGVIEFVPARSRAWGCARGLTQTVGNPVDTYSEDSQAVRWKVPWCAAGAAKSLVATIEVAPREAPTTTGGHGGLEGGNQHMTSIPQAWMTGTTVKRTCSVLTLRPKGS